MLGNDKLEDNRPDTSPYTNPIIVTFGQSQVQYTVPYALLPPCIRNSIPPSFGLSIHKLCADIDADIAHTFVHYLYTGHYQTLKSRNASPSERILTEHYRGLYVYLAAKEYSLPRLESLARQQVEALDTTLPVGDALANVAPVFERLGDDGWLADYLHRLLVKVVSGQAPDSGLSSKAVGRIQSAFARALLRGVVRILDGWRDTPSRREKGLCNDVNHEMSEKISHESPHPSRSCDMLSNFKEFSKCGKESSLRCEEVDSEDKSQEALFNDPETLGSPCEAKGAKEHLDAAAEECTKEAAKDDMDMWRVMKPRKAGACEEKADTPVEGKPKMLSEECGEPGPADDTTCKSTEDYDEPYFSTAEAAEEPLCKEPELEPVLAEDQHAMLEPPTEESATEPACAESTVEKEPDQAPSDPEPSPRMALDAEAVCEVSCEGVPGGPVVPDSGDGMCDKMSEHLRSLNWRSCRQCSALIGLAVRQAAVVDGEFEFVEKLAE
ncbi:MAG: hypothetical protein Q9163_004071 [Psora crenata]